MTGRIVHRLPGYIKMCLFQGWSDCLRMDGPQCKQDGSEKIQIKR